MYIHKLLPGCIGAKRNETVLISTILTLVYLQWIQVLGNFMLDRLREGSIK